MEQPYIFNYEHEEVPHPTIQVACDTHEEFKQLIPEDREVNIVKHPQKDAGEDFETDLI